MLSANTGEQALEAFLNIPAIRSLTAQYDNIVSDRPDYEQTSGFVGLVRSLVGEVTGRGALDQDVQLSKPVTPEAARNFNQVLGRKRR